MISLPFLQLWKGVLPMMKEKIVVSLKNIVKSYGSTRIINNINLDIYEGEFLTLLGSSGCGKTTTLRIIGGFEDVTSGNVCIDGVDVTDLESYHRNVNTVFQNYALFPHMTVFDNVAFGLVEKKMKKAEIREKVMSMLELVQLKNFEKRMPSQLSGGQKQRVAIARALINEPKVLLLDEPLGALDLKLRKQMQMELKHLQKQLGITFIFVTHDQEEAMTMSDRIIVMNLGAFEQIGTPREIYHYPMTRYVADFIGESNILKATDIGMEKDQIMATILGKRHEVLNPHDLMIKQGYISIRPECISLTEILSESDLVGEIVESVYTGASIKTSVKMPNETLINVCEQTDVPIRKPGTKVSLLFDKENAILIQD